MANDNQTALMISIQRKKDQITHLSNNQLSMRRHTPLYKHIEIEKGFLREQIAEDEKLLTVDRARNDLSREVFNHLRDALTGMEWRADVEPETLDKSDYEKIDEWREVINRYNEKYGTDGK